MASAPTRTATSFRVLVLGPFELERDGVRIETAKWQRRVGSLFKLLATAPDQRRRRDEVIETLWPEMTPETGMANLRIAAHRLRQSLGGGDPLPILAEGGWIGLNPAYAWQIDLTEFEELAREGSDLADLERALSLYRGEPLVEDRYEDWAIPIRERIQRTWREAVLRLADAYAAQNAYDQAAERLEQTLAADPLDEEALRRLLEVLYAAGRRADALRRYRQFEQNLADELGVPPSPETMAVVQRLHAEYAEPVADAPPPESERPIPIGRFLGSLPESATVARGEELERIELAIELAERGTGRLVLLRGERGAGKTRLAQEAMLRLRDRGFVVATARCYQVTDDPTFSPFVEAIHHLRAATPPAIRRQTASLWASLDTAAPNPTAKPFWAITDLLIAIADRQPVALLFDDLDRADRVTIQLLQHLSRQVAGRRVFLLGTYCDDGLDPDYPLQHIIRDLGREGLIERVTVPRLSLDGTMELIDLNLGRVEAAAEFAEFVYRRTKGNPFYIDSLLQALGGRYCLIQQIGRGGMGRVFEAIDTENGEQVAVKIMFARSEADPRALQRFEQEGEILARLDHPNIVRVFQTVLDEHTAAIAMELLDGVSLRRFAQQEQPDLTRVGHLAQQVLAALGCAHQHGIVHRDIKPDNIMVLSGDRVKVTDFGVARLVRPSGDLTTMMSTGISVGTPLYMAPEQIEGRRLDGRADLYSLGCVLYELVTGRPPFDGDDPLVIAFKQVNETPRPPRELTQELPPAWEALILRALAKNPDERFPSAEAMLAALTAADSAALPTAALPVAPLRPSPTEVVEENVSSEPGFALVRPPEPAIVDARPMPAAPRGRWLSSRPAAAGGAVAIAAVMLGALFLGHPFGLGQTAAKTRPTAAPLSSGSAHRNGPGQLEGPTGIAVDARGNVFVVDSGNNRIQEFSPAGRPIAQFGSPGSGPDQLTGPTDVSVGPNGDVYVADDGNKRIVVFSPTGHPLTIVSHWTGRPAAPETFNGVTVDRAGNIFATDVLLSRVVELKLDGTRVAQWGQPGRLPGQLHKPEGVAVDTAGHIYVGDTGNNRIQKFSPSHQPLAQWGNLGSGPNQFHRPQGLALDAAGDVYVADTANNRIVERAPDGHVLHTYGHFGDGKGQLNQPAAVAVDGHGNIYVSDYYNNRIEKFAPSGSPLWASHGLHPGW